MTHDMYGQDQLTLLPLSSGGAPRGGAAAAHRVLDRSVQTETHTKLIERFVEHVIVTYMYK